MISKNGRVSTKVGTKFHEEIEKIKDCRLRNGNSKTRDATHKLTNIIVRHSLWDEIQKHIINLSQEEIEHYGNPETYNQSFTRRDRTLW